MQLTILPKALEDCSNILGSVCTKSLRCQTDVALKRHTIRLMSLLLPWSYRHTSCLTWHSVFSLGESHLRSLWASPLLPPTVITSSVFSCCQEHTPSLCTMLSATYCSYIIFNNKASGWFIVPHQSLRTL